MPSGINACIPRSGKHTRVKRGTCKGWSEGACQRNARFLRSVDHLNLDGIGITFTLTVRELPASAKEWARLRQLWIKRAERAGAYRMHWVTEWTRRGIPHLHIVAFFDENASPFLSLHLTDAWIEIAGHLGAAPWGQYSKPMNDPAGWFGYVSKHSARGVKHYQRQMASLPPSWASVGRVWGRRGDWPTRETEVDITIPEFHRLRRLLRSYLVAQARADLAKETYYGNPKRISAARRRIGHASRSLRCHDKRLSSVRGLGHWVPEDVQQELLSCAWDIEAWKSVHCAGAIIAEPSRRQGEEGVKGPKDVACP